MGQAIIILDLLEITPHIQIEEDILDLVHQVLVKAEAIALPVIQLVQVVGLEEAQVVQEVAAR